MFELSYSISIGNLNHGNQNFVRGSECSSWGTFHINSNRFKTVATQRPSEFGYARLPVSFLFLLP